MIRQSTFVFHVVTHEEDLLPTLRSISLVIERCDLPYEATKLTHAETREE